MSDELLPHPVTGQPFPSPVPPGSGWPGDPATSHTPVAATPPMSSGWPPERGTSRRSTRTSRYAGPALGSSRGGRPSRRPGSARRSRTSRTGGGRVRASATLRRASWSSAWRPPPTARTAPDACSPGDRSGDWLYAALHRTGYASQPTSVASGDGLVLTGLRIVASVRCAPPANKPTPLERDTCGAWLDRDLALAAPRLRAMLALGSIAWDATLASARRVGWTVPRPKPRFAHGGETVLRPTRGRPGGPAVASYHVSQQNTFTGKLTEPMLDAVLRRL